MRPVTRAGPAGQGTVVRNADQAKVDVIEFLGNDELIHAMSDGRDVVAIVPAGNALKVGDTVTLSAPPQRLHLFDLSTGAAMLAA